MRLGGPLQCVLQRTQFSESRCGHTEHLTECSITATPHSPLQPGAGALSRVKTHLDEGLGEAGALGVIPLHIHRLLLNVHALVMHMVPVVVLVPVGDLQLGSGKASDVGAHLTGAKVCSAVSPLICNLPISAEPLHLRW